MKSRVTATVLTVLMAGMGFVAGYQTAPEPMIPPIVAESKPRSPQWPTFRKHFLEKNPACEVCGARKSLEVHHEKPYHLFPELELQESNVHTLCLRHHFVVGHLENYTSYNEHLKADIAFWRKRLKSRP